MAKKKVTTVDVKRFWEDQAQAYKESQLATNPDTHYRDIEMESILRYLPDGKSVLDVGCGNGYSTFHFAHHRKGATFFGVDYSESMVAFAKKELATNEKKLAKRVSFAEGDVMKLSSVPELKNKKFDYIISERCLINLANWKEQQVALLEMKKLLKKGGRIILTENTQEGLARLNGLRKQFELAPISVRWHNYYMPENKLIDFAKKHFRLESVENHGNLYYIISRVVYAKLAALEGKDPDYNHPINVIAAQLPTLGEYHFSPNFIFILRNA